ncbi:hypothetical protein C6P41_000838 [Kluyveromyces marxianus]|nr:hypothetical protein C6P43_004316 [Kluyveromyces marxianus]KAG0679076.1 hypothetical protein C6P41_000838 [Kluyveromyces marxianus]
MSTVNVLRYSALALGVAVGLKTDLSLKSAAEKEHEKNELEAQLKLLHPVKKETAAASSTKIDLEDPNLDYAAVILNAVESLKQ